MEWSGQQNPQRSHAAEQMSGEAMQKARTLLLWGSTAQHSLLGALFEQHTAKLGVLLSAFGFH